MGGVEDVEEFGTELEAAVLADFHVAEEGHVKVDADGVVHGVASGVALGEAAGSDKAAGVADDGADGAGVAIAGAVALKSLGKVRVGVCAFTKGESGVIEDGDAVGTGGVDDAEGGSGLRDGESGERPVGKEVFDQAAGAVIGGNSDGDISIGSGRAGLGVELAGEELLPAEERQLVLVVEIEELALVEVAACAVCAEVEGVYEVGREAIGCCIDGVRVGVGEANVERPLDVVESELDGVIGGVGRVGDGLDFSESAEGTEEVEAVGDGGVTIDALGAVTGCDEGEKCGGIVGADWPRLGRNRGRFRRWGRRSRRRERSPSGNSRASPPRAGARC